MAAHAPRAIPPSAARPGAGAWAGIARAVDPKGQAAALLAWYRGAARDLPWRRDPTPYHVLLSELMLQQTRVDTALPYFERFTARWPTLEALAEADEDDVLREWAGLGYYARARNLLRCARAAVAGCGLPDDLDGLRALPGIGPYTAGAIASIAFGVRTPLVDGNVERVLSRLDALTADPRREGRQPLWDRAAGLHEGLDGAPGDLNQALMELGATVCTHKAPRCGRCPLAAGCAGRADPGAYPVKAPKPPPKPVWAVAGLLRSGRSVLLGRRRKGGLLGGLWEPVRADLAAGAHPEDALLAAFLAAGFQVRVTAGLGEVVHVFTHRRLACSVYALEGEGTPRPGGPYDEVRWLADPEQVGLSALARRILAMDLSPPLPFAATSE